MMNVKEIYLKLVKDEIKVSEALAFTQIFVSLSTKGDISVYTMR